ncbi:hypothetical protein CDAR_179031 [Caerostris darwini]|uniref:Secreted protein n=1 Tax=Caerostris darwini TaxID=1538125 RepID=A0AAV4P9X6_9ARAC|nr:hypothetical protein CDAR_179031 [Caerostris darwini]
MRSLGSLRLLAFSTQLPFVHSRSNFIVRAKEIRFTAAFREFPSRNAAVKQISFARAMKFERADEWKLCCEFNGVLLHRVFGELGTVKSQVCGWRPFYEVFLFRCSEQHVDGRVGGIKVSFSAESASFAFPSFDESACLLSFS